MPYRPLTDFVLRAPLLPVAALAQASRQLRRHPLGPTAVSLASPSLAARLDTPAAARALDRYARRAAFRTTPHGLLSGVTMGRLGAATRIATGRHPRAHLDLGWQRTAALARTLLNDPAIRPAVRIRQTPSLLRAADSVRWLAMGFDTAEERQATCDARLERLLAATVDWTPWAALRSTIDEIDDGLGEDTDEFLLLLLDDGLLLDDLTPPLLGPPPLTFLTERLAQVPAASAAATALAAVAQQLRAGDVTAAGVVLRAISDDAAGPARDAPAGIQAVLLHQPARPPTLARAAVERAAKLAPLLFRLQEALAAPASERLADASLGEALTAVVESFGAGALDVGALASGDYGVPFDDGGSDGDHSDGDHDPGGAAWAAEPPRALLTFLMDAITAALVSRHAQVDLSSDDLAAVLGDQGPAPPPTAELFLTPSRPRAGARPGTGWLLGLHAPAGSSWGRFAHALSPGLPAALARLRDAERACFPDEERADVAYAPSPARADLCAHPPLRASALALTSWPAPPTLALTPAALELCADPAALVPLSLRHHHTRAPLTPSPLARVRSTTAPAGIFRLLTGWSLYRQHAPWALTLGPLAELDRLPRITVDGFVISPASWRVPPAVADGDPPAARRALARWRRAAGLPRVVQTGHEDELLPVDLARAGAIDDLRGAARVWEIWPPLGATVDDDGRRVEAVVAICDHPDGDDRRARTTAAQTTRTMGPVSPPRVQPAADGWTTFTLFGAAEHQDRLLVEAVLPAIDAALVARTIDAWFFLRYRQTPGPRPQLRLRIHGSPSATAAFASGLETALPPLRQQGAVVAVEIAPYFPERARLGDPQAVAVAHRIYQSDSTLVAALLQTPSADDDALAGDDTVARLVRSFDALAAGCGLTADARWKLAAQRRRAVTAGAPASADEDAEFRARSRALRAALAADEAAAGAANAGAEAPFAAHRRRVSEAVTPLSADARAGLLPTLLHLAAVRMVGPHRDAEARATIFWERTREGLARSRPPRPAR